MTTNPLAEALDNLAAARGYLDATEAALEELQAADEAAARARIRPYFDMWRTRIAHVERQRVANELATLTRWKAEAIEVLDQWEEVWKALGSPGGLGESKARASRAKAAELMAVIGEEE